MPIDSNNARRLFRLSFLVSALLLVAACSSDQSGDTSTTTTSGSQTTTTAEASTTTAEDPSPTEEPAGPAGTVEVALVADILNFDPQSTGAINRPIIKNLYDSLIEYTAEGEPVPALATSWEIADDNTSIEITLRDGVRFHSGSQLDSSAVVATLEKAADPERGANVFPTMGIVSGWEAVDDMTVVINFTRPVADREITDLIQFISIIDPEGIDDVADVPAGTGPFVLDSRSLGQSIRLLANPDYWGDGPYVEEVNFTVFDDGQSAAAALESGLVDLIYNVPPREGVRLADAGFELHQGPGPLVEVLRLNPNRGPLTNQTFRQGLARILNREAMLEAGYGNLGEVSVLPWASNSPAADPSFNDRYSYDPDAARALFEASGLTEDEMSDWTILANSGNEAYVLLSQILQADLAEVGIDIEIDLASGADWTDRLISGDFDAVFGGFGNNQKFPARIVTNSILRTSNNPIVGDPVFPAYVEAMTRVSTTLGPDDEIEAAYANLNEVMMDLAWFLPTNTYAFGLVVASPDIDGIAFDIDNMLVLAEATKEG